MKCSICKCPTTWEESFGTHNFLVCEKCYYSLVNTIFEKDCGLTLGDSHSIIYSLVFACGELRKEAKENG